MQINPLRISVKPLVISGVLLIFLTQSSCQNSHSPPARPGMVLIDGIVTLDQSPLDQGQVTLIDEELTNKDDDEQWRVASIVNGKFQLEAAPGRYQVQIQKYEYRSKPWTAIPLLPERYNKKSTLTAEIKTDGPNKLSFNLTSDPK